MIENKKYFHELSQEEIKELAEKEMTWSNILIEYKQPEWCTYEEALNGVMGCLSLTDVSEGGLRGKINEKFCSTCQVFKKQ